MKNKIITIAIVTIFLITSIVSIEAIAPTPKVELNDYQLTVSNTNSVYVSGTVNISVGQMVGLYDSTGNFLYNYTTLGKSNGQESFKIQIPSMYLKEGENTFKVKSLPIRGVINGSNSKTFKVNVKTGSSKKDQTITASNLELKVNETKNLNAKTSSGLPLTYVSDNANIATVDAKGNVIGRKVGTTKVTIKQAGNDQYNPVSKVITITVKDSQPTINKKNQTITANNITLAVGETKSLKAKTTSKLSLSYKSEDTKIATVDTKGNVKGKKVGKTKITISQAGNNIYNPASKTITVTVTNPTYTIVYHGGSDIGGSDVTGKMSKQVVSRDKTVKLSKNKFTKKDYVFVGWAVSDGRASKNNSTHVEKFKNINMTHFQLGSVKKVRKPSAVGNGKTWKQLKDKDKQYLTNKCSVKNLAKAGETIHLYAVWKGNGPQAAVDWAYIIAKDDHFMYGTGNRAHQGGCYYCGTNITGGKHASKGSNWEKTYCCNPFVAAAYVHGANIKSRCGRINGHYYGGMETSSWTCYNSMKGHKGKFKQISKNSKLKPGDIFTNSHHVWMYAGNGKRVEAGSEGFTASSIRVKSGSSRGSASRLIRYYPNN